MAISSGDLVNMRTGQQLVKPHLNVTPKVTIATMRVNQSSFSYPLAQLTVDNVSINGGLAFADIPVGSLVYVGTSAGAHDVTTSVIRKSPSGTTLFISAIGPGDPGFAQQVHTALANNQYITVLAVKPLWSLLSRISGSTFYKRFDVAYVDEGSDPDPVCNIGPWRRLALTGASVSDTFTNAAVTDVKAASFAWGSKTKSSYAWTTRNSSYALNTGAAFDGGVDNTEAVTITFDTAGFYLVYCTLTDSGGKTHTAETYVWVDDGTVDLTGWYIDQDKQDTAGRQISFGIDGDTAESVVFPGAGFLYTEEHTFNSTTVTAGTTVTTFAGYVKQEKPFRQITHGKVLFEVVSPAHILKDVPMASQYIIEDASPTNWTEATSDLTHPSGVAWYLLQHHCPAMLQVFDFAPLIDPSTGALDTGYRDHTWLFTGKDLWSQISEIVPHQVNVGCDSQGALYLRHDPQLMDTTDRAALDERMTWGAGDIRDNLDYSQVIRNPIGLVDGYAFSYNGTSLVPYWGRSPGDSQGQGKSQNTINGMIVPAASAQTDLNRITGHQFAKANNPTPQIIIKAMRNLDTADPARMVWHELNVSATYDPRGVGWSNKRVLPIKVNRKWERQESGTWLKRIDITMQPETSGRPAITKQVPVSSESDWDLSGDWFDPFAWGDIITDELVYDPLMKSGQSYIALVDVNGYLYTTSDFMTESTYGGPTWAQTALGIANAAQFVVDAFSPGYTGAGSEVNGWIVSSTDIYRVTDLFGVPAAVSQHTFANTISSVNIDFSFGLNGWGVCVYNSLNNGVFCTYTTDGGSTWSTDAAISAHYATTEPNGIPQYPGLYVSPKTAGLVYAGAWTATGGAGVATGGLFKSTDYGATWAASSDFVVYFRHGIGCDFHIPYARENEDLLYFTESYMYFSTLYYNLHVATSTSYNQVASGGNTWARFGTVSSPQDDNYMASMLRTNAPGSGLTYLNVSTNGFSSSTAVKSYGNARYRVAIAGDNKYVLYMFGDSIEYTDNFGATIDNRHGNLSSFPSARLIGIAGGVS